MSNFTKHLLVFACLTIVAEASAETITLNFAGQQGAVKSAGTIEITQTPYGLLFTPNLHNFTAGLHGFHIHENPDCNNKAMAAGDHLDPTSTEKHLGPYNDDGHLGDLPALYAQANGTITTPVLAPRFKEFSQISNHALVIHAGGDNYSDTPQTLGGAGNRIACGIIK